MCRTAQLAHTSSCSLLADQAVKRSTARKPFDGDAVRDETAKALPLCILSFLEPGEAEIIRDVDLHATWELEFGTPHCLNSDRGLLLFGAERHQHLANVDTSSSTI